MKRILLILLPLFITTSMFGRVFSGTAVQQALIPEGAEESNIIWTECNIKIFITAEKYLEKFEIYSKQTKSIVLISLTRKDVYKGIETFWYIGKDETTGVECKVMVQFLSENKMALGILSTYESYKYIININNSK